MGSGGGQIVDRIKRRCRGFRRRAPNSFAPSRLRANPPPGIVVDRTRAPRHPLRWVGLLLGLGLPGVATAEPSPPTLITRIDVDGNGTPDFEYRGGETLNS